MKLGIKKYMTLKVLSFIFILLVMCIAATAVGFVKSDRFQAVDSTGLELLDSNGKGIFVNNSEINVTATKFITRDPWVDVRSFGAKGDGTTDDTVAVQAAIDSLGSNGGTVFFPVGTYLLGGIEVNKSSIQIIGDNKGLSKLKAKVGSIKPLLRFAGAEGAATHIKYNALRDMYLDGNNQVKDVLALEFVSIFDSYGIYVSGGAKNGILLQETFDSNFYDTTIMDIQGAGSGYAAIWINGTSTDNTNQIRFYGCHLEHNQDHDVVIDDNLGSNNNHIWFRDCHFEDKDNISTSVWLKGTRNDYIHFKDSGFGNYNNATVIKIDSAGHVNIHGNYFTNTDSLGNGGVGVHATDGYVSIKENTFYRKNMEINLSGHSEPWQVYHADNRFVSLDGGIRVNDTTYQNDNMHRLDAAPTTGKWTKGAIVWNKNPNSITTPGWINTVHGNNTVFKWLKMAPLLDTNDKLMLPAKFQVNDQAIFNASTNQIILHDSDSGEDEVYIGTDSSDNLKFYMTASSTIAMMVKGSNAYIGIGVNDPQAKLHVDSGTSDTVGRFVSSDVNADIRLEDDTNHSIIRMSAGSFEIYTQGYTTKPFDLDNNAITNAIRVTSTGVAIGATSNSYLLDVAGTFQANDYYSGDGSQGATDTTSYWLCTAADCSTKCQVSIKDGLITACT